MQSGGGSSIRNFSQNSMKSQKLNKFGYEYAKIDVLTKDFEQNLIKME